jgi:3-keto-L-gulonate-6-phosphate decarboxylase
VKIPKLAFAFVSAAILFASAAIAGETNKTTVRIDQKVTVDGKTLDSGKYTAQWTGDGPAVQVTLMKGKNTVATFAAQIKQEPSANPDDAIGTTNAPDGSKELSSIYPGGKRISLQLNKDGAGAASNSSPSR